MAQTKHTFREGAEDFYDVEAARKLLAQELPEGCAWWRCVLCGWPLAVSPEHAQLIGACCCGGCGMTTLRPIGEYGDGGDCE